LYDGFEENLQAWLACAFVCTGAQGDVPHLERDSAGRHADGDDGAGVGERDVGLRRPAALRDVRSGLGLLGRVVLLGLLGLVRGGGRRTSAKAPWRLLLAVLVLLGAPMVGLRSALRRRGELLSGKLLLLSVLRCGALVAEACDGVSDDGVVALHGAVLAVLAVLAVRVLLAVQAVQVLLAVLTLLVGMSSSGRCRDTANAKTASSCFEKGAQ
jgi:hypothetical protein